MDDVVVSKRIQRSALAAFLPTQRLIKEFEAISADVAENIPRSIEELAGNIELARSLVNMAAAIANAALEAAQLYSEGPPPAPQVIAEPEDQYAQLCQLREQLAVLTRRVNDLEERPTP